MKIYLDSTYIKHYRKRITPNANLNRKTTERIKLFQEDSRNPVLKDHSLAGTHSGHRAFWVTGNIRVVYENVGNDEVLFLDIGTHPQVY